MEGQAQGKSYNSYAKVNLSLEILRKRPDGYHDIASVLQTIDLYDILHIASAADLQFDCNLPELVNENNLVWQAALRLQEISPLAARQGANIYLEKRIPVAAGIGGGSSNAATTLKALNKLWNLNLTQDQLLAEAATLGSDVPFFLIGGTVLLEGRGEKLTPLPSLPNTWLVLVYPLIEMPPGKTRELYKTLDRNDFTAGAITRTLVRSLERGEQPPISLFFNGFEKAVYERFPRIDYYRQTLVDAGADHVWVSGSGPTLFTAVGNEEAGQIMLRKLQQANQAAYLVRTIDAEASNL